MNIEGNIAIICITENGKKLALKINSLVNNCVIYQVKNKKSKFKTHTQRETATRNQNKFKIKEIFEIYDNKKIQRQVWWFTPITQHFGDIEQSAIRCQL